MTGTERAVMDMKVARLAQRQYGLVTVAQLAEIGLSPRSIRRRVASGALVAAGVHIFATSGTPRSWEQSALAACLDSGPGAALSHTSAANVWRLDVRATTPFHVTVPYGRSVRRAGNGIVLHRSLAVEETRVGSMPATSLTRTIVDLAAILEPASLSRVVDDALARRLINPEQLRAAVERASKSRRTGIGALRRIVAPWLTSGRLESVAEARFLRTIVRAGLPRPAVQHVIADAGGFVGRTDFAWPERMLILEVDGFRWHADPRSHARDSQRANRLAACGWRVLHATPAELHTAPAGVVAALRRHLLVGGDMKRDA